jgi:transposase
MKTFRPAIIRMHERGVGIREISRLLGVPVTTVFDDIRRNEETGSNEDRPGRGQKKTARSQRNVQRARGMIQRNPKTKANSTRKLAKKLGVSPKSAHRILREDLGLKPYKMKKRQKLTAAMKLKRLLRAQALCQRFSQGHRMLIFSDEKLFDIQQVGVFATRSFIF